MKVEKNSTSRREALKVTGASIAGAGLVLFGLGAAGTEASGATTTQTTNSELAFRKALSRLVNDATFRTDVVTTPTLFTKTFPRLSVSQLALLLDVGAAGGGATRTAAGGPTWTIKINTGGPVYCCCCCCA